MKTNSFFLEATAFGGGSSLPLQRILNSMKGHPAVAGLDPTSAYS
jgi:hypothetical protein